MRIVKIGMIVENECAPDIRVEREAQALSEAGYEVHILALNHGTRPEKERQGNVTIHRFYFSRKLFRKLAPLALTFPFYFQKWKKPLQEFLSKNFDIIHLHDLPLLRPVQALQKNYGYKLIVDLHENRPAIMQLYSHVHSFPGKWLISIKKWEEYQQKFLPSANGIIVVTEKAREQLLCNIQYNPSRVIDVMNTVSISEFRNIPVKKEIIQKFSKRWNLVYVGVTGKRRGIDIAIQALERIKSKTPEINLILVGSGRDDGELEKMVHQYQLEDHVYFAGWVPSDEINSYILASQAGISPIRRNPHHDTTLANKITQYLALGKPIIVSDCPAQVDIIEKFHCGLVYHDGDVEDLAEKILDLYQNHQSYLKMQKNALTASEKLDWSNEKKKLIRFYEELIENEHSA